MHLSTHSQRLDRWLGDGQAERISQAMKGWYGPPIAIANVPGRVYVGKDGDFVGPLKGGFYGNLADYAIAAAISRTKKWAASVGMSPATGFASLSALIDAATVGGKMQQLSFTKTGVTNTVGRSGSLWGVGPFPIAGSAGGTTGTGAARTRTTTGGLGQADPTGSDTLHLTTMTIQASVAGQMLLLYDRLWDMTHTMTVSPRSVDGANVPTRYQTTTAAGSFISGEVTTVLPAATPTITFNYVDENGSGSSGAALSTIQSAAAVGTVPFLAPHWFYPLAGVDTGVRALQNSAGAITLSAAMASGVVTWFVGHPIAFVPVAAANTPVILDGINSAFNLSRIQTDACLAFLEIAKGAVTATNWWGAVTAVSG